MVSFWIVISALVVERLLELTIASRNTQRLRARGGEEFGASHYPLIVALHTCFIFSLLTEELLRRPDLPAYWPWMACIFAVSQIMRFWTLTTLGSRWTTRVIVVPHERLRSAGPYRFLTHPNYVVVALEIASIPLTFGLHWTALIFTVLNAALLLFIRIPLENRVLGRYASRVSTERL
jgi:methyltransferase